MIDANEFARANGSAALREATDRSGNHGNQLGNMRSGNRFNLIRFDQIERKQTAAYLIKGVIPRTGIVVIWGKPKCGKSFWTFDAMLHVAIGRDYRGRPVARGTVVYLALEGQDGFGDRAEAFRLKHLKVGDSVPEFYLVKERTDLTREHFELVKCIKSQCGDPPSAVVIDMMNRSLVGSESKDEDMAEGRRRDPRFFRVRGDRHPSLRHR